MKTKVIAMLNNKGGVGKTTCIANIAYSMAKQGKDVLVIDFDSQASLSNCVNIGIKRHESYYSIYEMLLCDLREIPEEDDPVLHAIDPTTDEGFAELCKLCIHRPTYSRRVMNPETRKMENKTIEFGFDVIPSKLPLSDYELELLAFVGVNGNYGTRLYSLINRIIKFHEYDYILIDCSPSIGVMTMNAIIAAKDGILIPTNLDLMSTRGVPNIINRIVEVQQSLSDSTGGSFQHFGVIGVILTLYAERRTVDKKIESDLNRFFPYTIFKTQIPESSNAKKALFAGALYSQIYAKAEEAFDKLTNEIFDRIAAMEQAGPSVGPMIDELDLDMDEEENDE